MKMMKLLAGSLLALMICAPCDAQQAAPLDGIVHMQEPGTYALCPSGGGYCFTPGSTNPVGAASLSSSQVSVGATATQIVAARVGASGIGRVAVTIVNTGTTAVYLGGSGVTAATGTLLPGVVGASVTINTTAAVYGIVASGTETVTESETY